MFPDAPTLRGQKHLTDLERLAQGAAMIRMLCF